MKGQAARLRAASIICGIVGYGCLAAFLWLVSTQLYRWFREGEWTHVGMSDGLRAALTHCCVKDGDTGRLTAFVSWLDSPVDWLGVHQVLEVVPASLALFALSIAGNCLFIYFRERLQQR